VQSPAQPGKRGSAAGQFTPSWRWAATISRAMIRIKRGNQRQNLPFSGRSLPIPATRRCLRIAANRSSHGRADISWRIPPGTGPPGRHIIFSEFRPYMLTGSRFPDRIIIEGFKEVHRPPRSLASSPSSIARASFLRSLSPPPLQWVRSSKSLHRDPARPRKTALHANALFVINNMVWLARRRASRRAWRIDPARRRNRCRIAH
jgi:hypothetical protein